jgi:hypothetical protein
MGELYPHPKHSIVTNNTEIILMTLSNRVFPSSNLATGKSSECHVSVIFL